MWKEQGREHFTDHKRNPEMVRRRKWVIRK